MRRPCLCLVDVALFSLPLEPQLLTPRFWVRGFGACFQPCRGEEAETRSCTFHLTMLSTVVSTDGAFQRLAAELFVNSYSYNSKIKKEKLKYFFNMIQ